MLLHSETASEPEDGAAEASRLPALGPAIELLGEYQGGGFKDPQYLLGRGDGQVVQVSRLLYLVAEALASDRDVEPVAEQVSVAFGRRVSAANVRYLVEEKLRPLGVIADEDGSAPAAGSTPLLGLKLRGALMPPRLVNAITAVLRPLFLPPVVVAVLIGFAAFDVWFVGQGVSQQFERVIFEPLLLVLVIGMAMAAGMFHELGHATACRYGGAKPGRIGIGIYLVWLVLYNDVTDTYRLDRRGRLRADLGGVYFNTVLILVTGAVYAATGFEPLLLAIAVQHLQMLYQFFPFIRLDGYYIVSDLTGVPDLFGWTKPILASLIPGRTPHPRVAMLKRSARVVVTVWVLITIPLLVAGFGLMAVVGPRFIATAWESIGLQASVIADAVGEWAVGIVVLGVVQIAALVAPILGMGVVVLMVVQRLARAVIGRLRRGRRHQAAASPGAVAGDAGGPGSPVPPRPASGAAVRLGGLEAKRSLARQYDTAEVDAMLATAATRFQELVTALRDTRAQLEAARDRPDDVYVAAGDEVARVLGVARAEAIKIRQQAEAAAAQVLEEAEDEKVKLLDDARQEVDELLVQGLAEYDQIQALGRDLDQRLDLTAELLHRVRDVSASTDPGAGGRDVSANQP